MPACLLHPSPLRVEVAALREELMAKRLATAEELLNQQDQQITGLEEVRGQTLLTVSDGESQAFEVVQ